MLNVMCNVVGSIVLVEKRKHIYFLINKNEYQQVFVRYARIY